MEFWFFMLICDLLIPIILMIAGRMMWKHCPQKINMVYGYRTKRSMINMETWKFAHDYCGKLWWKLGFILLVLSVLIHIPFYGSNDDVIGTLGVYISTIQLIVLITSIILVEIALKKTFSKDGVRKDSCKL